MRTIITKTFIAAAALCSAHAVAIAQDAPMGPTKNGPPPAAEAPAPAADDNIDDLRRQMKDMQERLERMSKEPKKEE